MVILEKSLENIGLSNKKAKIYLALLELGEASVIEIAKKAGLKRTTAYNILPELIQEGLIGTTFKKKKKLFFIGDVERLKFDAQEKVKNIEKFLPELKAIHNIIPYKPKITFYEGTGGMKDLYQDTLENILPGGTILSYTGLSDFYKLVPKDFASFYIDERVKRKIKIQIITPDSEAAQEWKRNALEELREIKIIKELEFKFNADMEIYANKVAIISYKEGFLGVIIESREINQMMQAAFELIWNSLE